VIVAYLALVVGEGLFILKASANIPISDTWGYVSILTKFASTGHVAWSHIFRFYGDGRPALEKFGLLIDAKYFGRPIPPPSSYSAGTTGRTSLTSGTS
jgi:hypothetical protein